MTYKYMSMIHVLNKARHWSKTGTRSCIAVTSLITVVYVITMMLQASHRAPSYFNYLFRQSNVDDDMNTSECLVRNDVMEKNIDLRIIVLTFNRAKYLSRLLTSLNRAEYDGDNVQLEVWIDVPSTKEANAAVMDVAMNFTFRHGCQFVNVQKEHVGIIGQWVYTWTERNNTKEIAVILEDDITVSPYFYRYLKIVHRKYHSLPFVNGFSLQGESIKHNGEGNIAVPKDHKVYLYPTLGTWGFSPNRNNWFEFVLWFTKVQKDPNFTPLVPKNIASSWYSEFLKTGKSDTMWEMWHIYFAWLNSEYTLYPNFKGDLGLTFNWKAEGLHYVAQQSVVSEESDLPHLLMNWDEEFHKHLYDIPVVVGNDGLIKQPPVNITGRVSV